MSNDKVSAPERSLPIARDVGTPEVRIRYVETGAGPPLLLLHDVFSSHLAWQDVLEQLAARFRVIAPDLPGFGDSGKPAPFRYRYGVEAFAESMVDLMAALGILRASICGHGLGSSIALGIAARHAAVVEKVMLVSPRVFGPELEGLARLATTPVVGRIVFKQFVGRALFRRHFRSAVYAAGSPNLLSRIDRWFESFDSPEAREAAYATVMATADTRPLVPLLARIAAPVLVACGRADRTAQSARRLARELVRARCELFECGRSPQDECPQAFATGAIAFLTNAGQSSSHV